MESPVDEEIKLLEVHFINSYIVHLMCLTALYCKILDSDV